MEVAQELDLFELTETEQIRVDFNKLKTEVGNLRRGLFSRHENLLKMYCETKDELEELRKLVRNNESQTSDTRLYFAKPLS